MTELVGALSSGLVDGCLYALVAVGFTLAFKAGGALNFAQSSLMVVGAYVAISELSIGNPLFGLLVACLLTAAISGGMYFFFLKRFVGKDPITITIITMGATFVIDAITDLVWHGNLTSYIFPGSGLSFKLVGDTRITSLDIGVLLATPIIFAIIEGVLRYTQLGIKMRAATDSPSLAIRSGVNVGRLYAIAWAISGLMAGLSGGLFAAVTSVSPNLEGIGLSAFPAAVLGGFGSVPGALLGGLVLGLIDQFSVYYINPNSAMPVSYIVMLLVLLIRPVGFFGSQRLVRS